GFTEERPSVRDLCNNQSGLRDYWALTVLCGADPEGVFLPEQAQSLLRRLKTTHFAPGTHYSYCNGNFRILADLIESHTGRTLVELLAER
ncbi:MAG TPA: aminopeptidase, partial [Ochrobactrum sp.]|nr:aminopeptidase [Ochrobactrum sp.]